MRKESSIHLTLPVSFRMVRSVVEQGQCMREKSMTLIAVTQVQPLATRSCRMESRFPSSSSVPSERYAMMMMGSTISLAGNPRMKAMRITPSSPISRAKGSRKPAQCESRLAPEMVRFAISQITSPAGAAMAAARPSTKSVRSSTERTMTLPI